MTYPGNNWVGVVLLKYIMVVFPILSKIDNIEDGVIYQKEIDFRLLDSSTISKTLEHNKKIQHNAAKCGKKWMNR